MSEVFWSVDSLVIKDNILFGFGWIFHEKHEISELRFRLNFSEIDNLPPKYIAADSGKLREDVKCAFANQPRALKSGYVVFGAFPDGAQIKSIDLVCSLEDGTFLELAVPASVVNRFISANKAESSRLMLRQFYVFFKRAAHLIRSGKFTSLFDKIRRYFKGRPTSHLNKPESLAALFHESESKNLCLIIDHDLGGGANQYRDRLVNSIIKDGRSVVILTYHVATLSHMLILRNSRLNLRFSIHDRAFLLKAIRGITVTDIIYNTAVSFAKPEEIPKLITEMKRITRARLKVLIHDFFLVCPSHFLIDHEGKHCRLPEVTDCASCLPRNQQGFTSLFLDRDIIKWRSIWGSLLVAADEIIAFSNNSLKLLLKAYPQIEKAKILVVPHQVTYLSGRQPVITNTSSLNIGIVGHIGFHKGSKFVSALAREIKNRRLSVKITVIGTIEEACEPSVVTQTGPYQHDDLPYLIEKTGANVFLFPSICPETFSYVVHELVSMNLPVVSFNLGAPAEKLATYPKGMVLDSMDPGTVLDNLISFHRKIYLTA